MRWSRQPPIPFITENKKGRPRPRKERIGKRQAMHRCWHPSRKANPESLKDKARGKCLICRQVRHWAKECPNHDKSPKTACYKCHQLGHWASRASGPKSLKVKCQPFPQDSSTGLKRPTPASPPVTDSHHGTGAKGATGCGR